MPCNNTVCDCHDGEPLFTCVDEEPKKTRRPKAYIAGPVRGNPDYHTDFQQAAQIMENSGYTAINPMQGDSMTQDEIHSYIESHWGQGTVPPYIVSDLAHILSLAGREGDIVVTLPDWESSPGARAEVAVANWIGVPVWPIDGFLLVKSSAEPIETAGCDSPKPVLSPREQLLTTHNDLCCTARDLMARKNHDYASNADPFRNFRTFGKYGILVRLGDKFSRLRSFEEQQTLEVPDETVKDTVLDIINYAVLYLAYD